MSKVSKHALRFSRAQLSELTGVTTKTIQRWESEGLSRARVAGQGARVMYDGPGAFQLCVQIEARKLAQADAAAAAVDDETGQAVRKGEWDARYARARALAAEMEVAADRGELVEVSRVRDVLARAAAVAKGLPRREAAAVGRMLKCEPRAAVPLLQRVSDAVLGHLRAAVQEAERA